MPHGEQRRTLTASNLPTPMQQVGLFVDFLSTMADIPI
jgi:hypothetical protein